MRQAVAGALAMSLAADRRKWRREDPFVQLSAMPLEISLDVD